MSATSSTACRAWPRLRQSAALPGSTRSTSTPTSCGPTASAWARSIRPSRARTPSVGGRVIHQGNAEYLIRSVGWIENLDDIRNTVVTQRERHADHRREYRRCPGRAGLPPQRAGEGRQGGGRRRCPDALRREPAGSHAADQGEDHRASGRAARWRSDRAVLRSHPLDPPAIETVSGTVRKN